MITKITEIEALEALSADQQPNIYVEVDGVFRRVPADLLRSAIGMLFNGGYQDEEGYVHLTLDGEDIDNFEPFKTGTGSGGGGGEANSATITVTNTTGWNAKTIPDGGECSVQITWSSIENGMPTGSGSLSVIVNGTTKSIQNVSQGVVDVDITDFLSSSTNTVKIKVMDVYGNSRTVSFMITSVALSIESSFDTTAPYEGDITFTYTPKGKVEKTVYFIVDGVTVGTAVITATNRQMSYLIPTLSHGSHSLQVYFEATINEETIRSNELYYEFIALQPGAVETIITSPFRLTSVAQYASVPIPFTVYKPYSYTADVTIKVNGSLVSTQTVDRTEQSYTLRANTVGTTTVLIESNGTQKEFVFTVTESAVSIEAETQDLVLYLSAQGRSNNEAHPDRWVYGNIQAAFTNFTWKLDGWQTDSDNINVMRLTGAARLTIPYQIFGTDFKNTGKTIEIEFATREVVNYNATILTCYADGIGINITPQMVTFSGAQTEISTLYKDNEHVRLSIVVEKQTDNRLILVYINGIMSRAIQYASGERFSQLSPVGITIGSGDCGIDIYNIRVYDNNLNRQQVLENWIADTQVGATMLDRFTHNNVYDGYGNITPETLPVDLPYFILEAEELPQFKGDKKMISGSYVDRLYPSNSFTFTGCQIDVQGTSSAIYYRKNYDLQFKAGFITTTGTQSSYPLRTGSIPFNRFVLKADVASSESANNTGLTMFYNDTCPYKTQEMEADPRVRWGIEGIPIAVFWNDTATGNLELLGKANFNLPKRAAAPYGYSGSGNMESWEFERNNSANVKFQDNDFTTMSWDEVEQKRYPEWYNDFEARFPSDEWRDYSKLNELLSWVLSTYREQATNATLPTPVVYRLNTTASLNDYGSDTSYTVETEVVDGHETGYFIMTFTKDTPAYRLTKFKAELGDYVEIQSAVFYYLFTEFFLMIDSRAKNMFIGFNGSPTNDPTRAIDRKATFQPYDMDTAVGTNNSGVLMFGYSLEDIDHVSSIVSGGTGGSDAPVFNAQDSVFWRNLRDTCRSEITAMYRELRTQNKWSYSIVETMYENHQSKWPEALYNEDAYIKYLVPLVDPVTEDEMTGQLIRTDRYLTMLQGSKQEQRKWWLWNRFRYMDSKFHTGDSTAQSINMRLFNAGTLTITTAIDMYACVVFGGGSTPMLVRTEANTPVEYQYVPSTGVTEMETWIYSPDLITDVGDLSVFYPNELDFSHATRIRNLKIGSSEAGYSNANMRTLDVRNSALLETIDVRNCPNLAITVDLEGSPRLKEAYFDGTAVTGVYLTEGGAIQKLHLPSTITTLILTNLNSLTEFVCPSFANVSRLMLTNMSNIDPVEILEEIQPNSQVNIQGIYLEFDDYHGIEDFLDLLDTMQGVTREKAPNGEWIYHDYPTAQISGELHTGYLTGAQFTEYNTRYPYLTITADHTSCELHYYTWDGGTLLYTETIEDGGNGGSYSGAPTRSSTADAQYTFAGWASTQNATAAESGCLNNVTRDRNVYAAYSVTPIYHLYYYNYNGTSLLYTENFVGGNGTGSYSGEPARASTARAMYTFIGWSDTMDSNTDDSDLTVGTANKSVYAAYSVTQLVVLSYYSYDGSELLHEEGVLSGGNGTWNGSPTRTATERILYNFAGWSSTTNASANESGVRSNITQDTTVYAAYTETAITYLKYYSYDGSELLHTDTIYNGANGTWNGVGPERTSTAQYSYSFVGWSTSPEQTAATSGATTSVSADRNVYAAYSQAIRSYTVYFYDGDTLLNTVSNVQYGATATYPGATPTNSNPDYDFAGWEPEPTNIQGNTTCRAKWVASSITRQYLRRTIVAVDNSAITKVGEYVFKSCLSLTQVNLPAATTIGSYGFDECRNLAQVSLPAATTISPYAFRSCSSLTQIDLPYAQVIGSSAFNACTNLECVKLSAVTDIYGAAFLSCKKLSQLYVLTSTLCTLKADPFVQTPFYTSSLLGYFGSIYVPMSLVDSYKSANGWSGYSNRITGYLD